MANLSEALLEEHHVLVSQDSPFQQEARLLQALWREARKLPEGELHGKPLGSRLKLPEAETDGSNFLTAGIGRLVRDEVRRATGTSTRYAEPRLWENLLSSQSLAFNLFGELRSDLPLAARLLARQTGGRVKDVGRIEFKYTPGRGDPTYLGDNTTFDVFVTYTSAQGRKGFLGFAVKYHEELDGMTATHRDRYDGLTVDLGWFSRERRTSLQSPPLEQLWRCHLLAGSLLLAKDFEEGQLVLLYPARNGVCAKAADGYRACLQQAETFAAWTLEDTVASARAAGGGSWVDLFEQRYLAFDKIDALAG